MIQPSTSSDSRHRAIAFRLDDACVVIDANAIDRLVEYDVAPLPLAGPWVAGIGVHEGAIVVSIRLAAPRDAGARRRTKAMLLAAPSNGTRWAIEIDAVLAFLPQPPAIDPRREKVLPAPWVRGAALDDATTGAWIDVAAMLADLGVEQAS